MILALDPSNKVTGYALGADDRTLTECGLLRPRGEDPIDRIWSMVDDVVDLMVEHQPERVVIETPAPQAPVIRGGDGRVIPQRGQANYGMAVGIILASARWQPGYGNRIVPVRADVWTRKIPKKQRQLMISQEFPTIYDIRRDPGGDASDAIGLLVWWFVGQQTRQD